VPRNRVLLAGTGDLYDEVCTALDEVGAEVTGLKDPDDESIRDALGDGDFDVVCVVAREDALPLRIALLVRHLDEDVPLVVTVFDREMAAQLQDSVPHLEVTSLADIVAPSLAGPCIDREITAIQREDDGGLTALRGEGDGPLEREPFEPPRTSVLRSLATSIFAPYDRSAALMFYGLMGLIGMLIFETIGAMMVLDQSFADALYGSTKSLATVGPNEAVTDGPSWFKVVVAASMILTLLSAACFTGGLIERLTSTRLTGLIGRRAVPRRDHIVVVGLGQVGLRLCVFLRECGFSVVAVDHRGDGRERRPGPAAEAAGRDRARGQPVDPARLVARPRAVAGRGHAPTTSRTGVGDGRPLDQRGPAGRAARRRRRRRRRGRARCCASGHVIDVPRVGAAFIAATAMGRAPRASPRPTATPACCSPAARRSGSRPSSGSERPRGRGQRGVPSDMAIEDKDTSDLHRRAGRRPRRPAAASPTPASRSGPSTPRTDLPEDLDLGAPASSPFTRGVHREMYRKRRWTMRQYAGYASARESNERYKYLLRNGSTGPLDGLRPARPARPGLRRPALPRRGRPHRRGDRHARGHADGLRRHPARRGLDLDDRSTPRPPCCLLLYELVAEEQGVTSEKLRGTTRTTSSRSTSPAGTTSTRPSRPCG
jgi:hypothetical protein